jgi:uncharacterized membrane protein
MSGYLNLSTRQLAAIAIMGALTTVVTMFAIPFAPTGGYFNLGDAVVVTTGLIFGPIVGAIAGGVGSSLSDVLLGYGVFAPYTLIIKGFEGFFVGFIAGKVENPSKLRLIVAWIVGGTTVVAGYWLAEAYALGFGVPAASAEIIINLPQAVISAIGIPVSLAVKNRLRI